MPENVHPITNLEQRMTELNLILCEKFRSFENVFEFLQGLQNTINEGAEAENLTNLILHFRCLNQLTAGAPEFADLIEERNSYKDGLLP